MKSPVFALVDCNNFFVSCERLFRPDLEGKPVVVLSSNDGVAVARSNEAKAIGIPMGAPAFKYRQIFQANQVIQFSANFELYGDISRRITDLLASVTPRIEIYSIDESFLDLSQLNIEDYDQWGKLVCDRVRQWIGVPVSIGIAPTKTLAKIATRYAKNNPETGGVLSLAVEGMRLDTGLGADEQRTEPYMQYGEGAAQAVTTPSAKNGSRVLGKAQKQADVAHILSTVPVKDVWGVGWRLAPRLRGEGIATALDLSRLRPRHGGQLMGVHGRQMIAELNGISCYPIELEGKPRQSIARTRTFGEDTSNLNSIEAALVSFVTRAAFRLRGSHQLTRRLGVFIQTSKHKPGHRSWAQETYFRVPTADTGKLITAATTLLNSLYNPANRYHRAGVYLWDFLPEHFLQTDLFGKVDVPMEAVAIKRMEVLDSINERFGRHKLRYAAELLGNAWEPKHQLRSPSYISSWEDLPIITR